MKLFQVANRWCQESSWQRISLLKTCLLSLGLMAGILVKKDKKKSVLTISFLVFLTTYIPLMKTFFDAWKHESQDELDPIDEVEYLAKFE